jgi:thiosulfate/3-mercaptopyruvate sulfurtransferase
MSTIITALALLAASPGLLVSPADLASMLKDPTVVVLAVGDRPGDFEAGHVPGARFVHYRQIAVDADGMQSELPPVETLKRVLTEAGVSDRSKVVVYGTPIAATRLFFTLDYLGHPHVRVLNGGLNAWKANGGAVETGAARAAKAMSWTPKPNPDRVVSGDWVKERLSTPKMQLLDARPDDEFTGADGGMRGMHAIGHLPGARQLVWNTLLDSSGFLPDAELQKKFEALFDSKQAPLVSYCMVGMRASVTYFVARHLGYDARMYDGSIQDWTTKKFPTVTGR